METIANFKGRLNLAFGNSPLTSRTMVGERRVEGMMEVAYRLQGLHGEHGPQVLVQSCQLAEGKAFVRPCGQVWYAVYGGAAGTLETQ